MILQALAEYYESLAARGEVGRPGWGTSKVSFVLELDANGELQQVISVREGEKLRPVEMAVPMPVHKTSGVASNFLCDNSSYILGVDNKGNLKRTLECFQACKELHEKVLESVNSPIAEGLRLFFESWNPEKAAAHSALQPYWEAVMEGGEYNLPCRWEKCFKRSGNRDSMEKAL